MFHVYSYLISNELKIDESENFLYIMRFHPGGGKTSRGRGQILFDSPSGAPYNTV